ncbi:MAG: ATPase [Bacteroidota bacterium]
MQIVADSGSTKTLWYLLDEDHQPSSYCETSGINPYFQQSSEIVKTLEKEFDLSYENLKSIYYYGSGISNEQKRNELHVALRNYFGSVPIHIESDLLGAARSLCGTEKGIVSILGTGSNSCFYDGTKIAENISSLGYALGDEGSGAYLGKVLIGKVFRKQFPQYLIKLFFDTYPVTLGEVLNKVYREPYPNRYLAGFTRFLSNHIQDAHIQKIVKDAFELFLINNIHPYSLAKQLPLHFTGSIAWHFRDLLQQSVEEQGFFIGEITQDPMEGLLLYHKIIAENQVKN